MAKEEEVEPEKYLKASIPVAETDSRTSDIAILQEVQQAWLNKEITFREYIDAVRAAGGEVTFGEIRVKIPESEKETIEDMMQQYKKGELSVHQMRRLIGGRGGEAEFWDYELSTHPDYGAEDSKVGFLWNPHHSHKGQFMQNVTKRVLEKMLDFVYKSCLKYDKDAFAFSDERLIKLKMYTDGYLGRFISVQYKKNLIRKAMEIALFVFKEDVYWRTVGFKFINGMPRDIYISYEEKEYFNRENPSVEEETEKE